MATKKIAFPFEEIDWETIRKKDSLTLWHGVMLSMGLNPSKSNLENLKTQNNLLYVEYKKRLEISKSAFNVNERLVKVIRKDQSDLTINRSVVAKGFVEFVKIKFRKESLLFLEKMNPPCVELDSGEMIGITDEPAKISTSQKNEQVRTGALIKIIAKLLTTNSQEYKNKLSPKNDGITDSKLGKEVEQVISQYALSQGQKTTTGFTQEANRKHIAKSIRSLDQRFKSI
jgi:hypothetical protein